MGQRTIEEYNITYLLDIRPKDFTDPKRKLRYPASSQILRVSRQLYEEGASILYGENRFYVDNVDDLKRIGASGEQRLVYVKNLVVRCSSKEDVQIQTPSPLISFSSLRYLTMITGFCEYRFAGYWVFKPFIQPHLPDKGSKVSASHPRLPAKLPLLSRLFLHSTIVERGVEVYLKVWHSIQFTTSTVCPSSFHNSSFSNKAQMREERSVDCYRVLPVSPDSPPNSSLIQREYDLVFEEFFEPS